MVLLAVATAGACAHRATPKLNTYDLHSGYRFERIAANAAAQPAKNSDDVFVVLALSGGGTRAAALSTGLRSDSAVAARRSRRHLFGVGW